MAVKKFILVAGQSNAEEVADAQAWEDKHPYVALRSPANVLAKTPQFSSGSDADLVTLPYTFKGGQQTNRLGNGALVDSWQYVNVVGKASQAIRYLTFYDPSPSYFNGATVVGQYPGSGAILSGSTASTINTNLLWQGDTDGLKITRRRTGVEHTVSDGWTARTNSLVITPAMVPLPEADEVFDYEVRTGADSTLTLMIFDNQFGGIANLGSSTESPGVSPATGVGLYGCYVSQIRDSLGAKLSARVTCRGRLVSVGDVVKFTDNDPINLDNVNAISVATDYYVTSVSSEGLTKSLASVSSWDDANNIIKLSGHQLAHQEAVEFTSGSIGGALALNTTYYVNNQVDLTVGHWDASTDQIYKTAHRLLEGEIIVFSRGSNLPTGDNPPVIDTPYVVIRVNDNAFKLLEVDTTPVAWTSDPTGAGATITRPNNFGLSTTIASPMVERTFASGGGISILTRRDSYADFSISTTQGGAEILTDGDSGRSATSTSELFLGLQEIFRGSLTGLQARCVHASGLAAGNLGTAKPLSDIQYDGSALTKVTCEAWDAAPVADDRFVIEVQDQKSDFSKWAMWLPWCPFEGRARYVGPGLAIITSDATTPVSVLHLGLLSLPQVGSKVRFYTEGKLPEPLIGGRDYYVHSLLSEGAVFYLKENYADTDSISGVSSTQSGEHAVFIVDSLGKSNPYPPGFNYPNHYGSPRAYQPFDANSFISKAPGSAFHTGLAFRLHEHLGEVMNVAVCTVGGTSIGTREVRDSSALLAGHSWDDPMEHNSWSPGDKNNCFARLLDVLDAAKVAFEADGDTGECIGIFWIQGEGDSRDARLASNYEDAARNLKSSMRTAIKDRSLTSLDADKIPFIHPKIKVIDWWTYASTVNAAIEALADEDPYSRTFAVTDLAMMSDGLHYDGEGITSLEDLCYTAWKDIQRSGSSEVDICNLALAHTGDKASITSINPSDGSHQADLCARYYPMARDLLLERHRWDFTIRQVSPTALSASGRTEWDYAYKLPSNFRNAISVIEKDSTDDQISQGKVIPQPFAIESDSDQERVLYCNIESAVLRYTSRLTDSSKFSQMFVHALSWHLAAMLAGSLIKGDEGAKAVRSYTQVAEFYAEKAAAHDSRTTREKPVADANTQPWDR